MSRFGSDPLSFFNAVYNAAAPWDIGTVQPAMAALLSSYPPRGPVLDLGCGSGDLAIYLARLGYQVTGIDFVEKAIAQAQEKASKLPTDIAHRLTFQVGDASRPSELGKRFGAIVDSGFFHLFDPDEVDLLIDELAATLLPFGQYYMHEFDVEFPVPNMPRRITAEEIEARFTMERGWQIKAIQPAEFHSRVAPPVPAICACIERLLM